MDFSLEWTQRQLQETARQFLEGKVDLDYLRSAAGSAPGYSKEIHAGMGELGLLSLGWAASGSEPADATELVLLYEELGRVAAPGPHFISGLAIPLLLHALGCDDHPLLSRVASGEAIATLAIYEGGGDDDVAATQAAAVRIGDSWSLAGTKMFVPYADSADVIIVLAKDQTEPRGLSLFEVAGDARGLLTEPLEVLSGERQCAVHLDGVVVPDAAKLGRGTPAADALESIRPLLAVAQSAELVGLAAKALDVAVAYAKDRIAFGHPIGSYQAIQHKCADMLADVDAARFLVYQAACLVNSGAGDDARIPMTKAFAAAAARRVTKEAHQILAGAGFVLEHSLNFYYRRVKGIEASFGDVNFQLDRVADRLLAERPAVGARRW